MKRQIRQIHSFAFGRLFSNRLSVTLLSWLNRRFRFLHTVFVAYPADEEYALAYIPASKRHLMRWKPWPVGLFRQGRKWGVTFVISSTERDFSDEANLSNLKSLLYETEDLCHRLGAQQTCYSGILPGVYYARRLRKNIVEADVTVGTLVEVERTIRSTKSLSDDVPIIVLGGRGFIGRRLCKALAGRDVRSVDIDDAVPTDLRGKPAMVFNVSRKSALMEYIDLLWTEAIVVNEVYPEPSPAEIGRLAERGIETWHVVGMKALSVPAFPKAYQGGIPCCAGTLAAPIQPILQRLTQTTANKTEQGNR